MPFCLFIYYSSIECLLLLCWFTFFMKHFFRCFVKIKLCMCHYNNNNKNVHFSNLGKSSHWQFRKPDDKTYIFTELFLSSFWYNRNKHRSGFLEAPEWNSKNYFKWISRFWPAIMIKNDFLADMFLGLNRLDWKTYS